MIGVGTFFWVLLIGCVVLLIVPSSILKFTQLEPPLFYFLGGSLVLGLICSWLGSYLWNLGSQLLPISFAGQLTIFETIFGLVFVYSKEASLPSFLEFTGIISILGGVGLSTYFLNKSKFKRVSDEPIHSIS